MRKGMVITKTGYVKRVLKYNQVWRFNRTMIRPFVLRCWSR